MILNSYINYIYEHYSIRKSVIEKHEIPNTQDNNYGHQNKFIKYFFVLHHLYLPIC